MDRGTIRGGTCPGFDIDIHYSDMYNAIRRTLVSFKCSKDKEKLDRIKHERNRFRNLDMDYLGK